MPPLLATLLGGGIAIAAVFFLLTKAAALGSKASALVAGPLAIIAYIAYALAQWPGADVVAIHVAVYAITAYVLGIVFARRQAGRGRFHWAPAVLVVFFLVVVVVNAILITVSQRGLAPGVAELLLPQAPEGRSVQSVFPGTVPHDYQENQKAYNRYVDRVTAQRERGWQLRKGWLHEPVAGQPAVFQLSVTDRHGAPVTGATVNGRFLRLADSRADQDFVMVERGIGIYQATLVLPEPGTWNLILEVRRGEDSHELRASTTVGSADQG